MDGWLCVIARMLGKRKDDQWEEIKVSPVRFKKTDDG